MAGTDVQSVNNDIESDSDSVLKLDISSDDAIRPFMFGPQYGSSSEEVDFSISEDQPQTEETETERTFQSRLGHQEWCICSNCQVMSTETKSICCQEMDVLGDRLNLKSKKPTFPITAKTSDYVAINQTGCRACTMAITCRAKGNGGLTFWQRALFYLNFLFYHTIAFISYIIMPYSILLTLFPKRG